MFDIGASELLVIGVVALVVIGPKELPGLLRTVGNATGKLKRMAAEFRTQFDEAMREADVAEAKKQFDDIRTTATGGGFNPIDTIRNELRGVRDEVSDAVARGEAAARAEQVPPAVTAEAPPQPDAPAPEPVMPPLPEPAPAPQMADFITPPADETPLPPKTSRARKAVSETGQSEGAGT